MFDILIAKERQSNVSMFLRSIPDEEITSVSLMMKPGIIAKSVLLQCIETQQSLLDQFEHEGDSAVLLNQYLATYILQQRILTTLLNEYFGDLSNKKSVCETLLPDLDSTGNLCHAQKNEYHNECPLKPEIPPFLLFSNSMGIPAVSENTMVIPDDLSHFLKSAIERQHNLDLFLESFSNNVNAPGLIHLINTQKSLLRMLEGTNEHIDFRLETFFTVYRIQQKILSQILNTCFPVDDPFSSMKNRKHKDSIQRVLLPDLSISNGVKSSAWASGFFSAPSPGDTNQNHITGKRKRMENHSLQQSGCSGLNG